MEKTTFKVTSPSMWLFVAAITAVTAGFLVWLFSGTVVLDTHAEFIAMDDTVLCWLPLDQAEKISPGMEVIYDRSTGTVTQVERYAEEYDRIRQVLGSKVEQFGIDESRRYYRIEIQLDTDGDRTGELSIVRARMNPAGLLLNLVRYQ